MNFNYADLQILLIFLNFILNLLNTVYILYYINILTANINHSKVKKQYIMVVFSRLMCPNPLTLRGTLRPVHPQNLAIRMTGHSHWPHKEVEEFGHNYVRLQ